MPKRAVKSSPRVPALVEQLQSEVKSLDAKLYRLQRWVIDTLPPHLARLLQQAIYARGEDVLDKIVEAAEPLSDYERGMLNCRAFCPLCKEGASSPYETGFAMPEGLLRHLMGHGNVRSCQVMNILNDLQHRARAHAEESSADRDDREHYWAARRMLSDETLYQTGPECAGQLAIESRNSIYGRRNQAQMDLTEGRLEANGFELKVDGRLRSLSMALREYVVYADARSIHGIEYRIFKGNDLVTCFELKDGVQELRKKIEARLKKALAGPPPPPTIEEERQRSHEPLYQTGPECPGQLKREARWYGHRRSQEMERAIEKLEALGFNHEVRARVHTITREFVVQGPSGTDHLVVYADPRTDDRVTYRVYLDNRLCSAVRVMDTWDETSQVLERRIASTLEGMFGARGIIRMLSH